MIGELEKEERQPKEKKLTGKMFAAVDIGSSKVCTLLASLTRDSLQIQGVGICPARGLEKGMVADIDQASESIRQSVKRAEQASGEAIDWAYIGIPGTRMSSETNRGVVAVGRKARTVRPNDVDRVLTSARDVDIPQERRLLHIIPTHYSVDGQGGIKDPVGMHGFRLDVDSHIVTVPSNTVENVIKCAHRAGLKVKSLVLQPLACAYVALQPEEIDAGVVIADIGASTTGIAAFKDGSVVLTSVLPVGGYNITRDIAIGLGVPFNLAEALKKQHGDLRQKGNHNNGKAIYTDQEEEDKEEEHYININYEGLNAVHKQDLNDIIRARVEEIMKLVVCQLPSSDSHMAAFPAGLVLAGGTANLPGIQLTAQEVTGLPARVARLSGLTGLADSLYDPSYVATVGIILCGGQWRRDQNWIGEGMSSRFTNSLKNLKQLVPHIKVSRG